MNDVDQHADFLEGLTLSPDWAKKSSDDHASRLNNQASRFEGNDPYSRGDGGRGRRDRSRDADRRRFDDRPNRPPRDRLMREPAEPPAPRNPTAPAVPRSHDEQGPRPPPFAPRRDRQPPPPPPPPPPFEIRFLPDQKALSVIARKVQSNHRAIPLRDLVKLFFDNPDSVEVRLAFSGEHKDRRFYQCATCGWFGLSEEALRSHILSTHFNDYFDSETIDVDPPTGNFTHVARCGITGRLLAPPNHHSYNKVIQQMLRTACATYTEEAYRARIERDDTPEAIEQWKQEASRKVVYFAKPDPVRSSKKKSAVKTETPAAPPPSPDTDAAAPEPADDTTLPDAPADAMPDTAPIMPDPIPETAPTPVPMTEPEPVERMSVEEAEDLFSRTWLPKLMKADRQVTVTHTSSKTIDDRDVLNAIARAWEREQLIQTASLFFAVRGGLRSRKLALFRASDAHREEFVMHKTPLPLDVSHAVPELRMIVAYIAANPGCTKTSMLSDLIPGDAAPEQAEAVLKQVAFITERAHVVEYVNGVLALAADHPYYGEPTAKKSRPARQPEEKPDPPPAASDAVAQPVEGETEERADPDPGPA